ncbi:phage tail tape measure protein [Nitrosomonas communis]|uniref:Phage tail tape measure protein, lambda family/phage tail tape measure protein, TP901 family, core region n=1 Tax=Nitrosomonas communis TaxID=44574 RepID=A0A1I4UVI7_9PROT|nr:phage tail tape measure protein [Nitrosomonas communis]SFM92961.1 phage tail tape measure protein, lambda family/phage tail tape measure protein, TP901 family, core region [Nitrosomonas communis]
MSALGSLVVSLALDYAQYTQGLDKSDQAALKFAQNAQRNFDAASASVTDFLKGSAAQAAAAIGGMVALNESFSRSLDFNKSLAQISTQIDGSVDDLNRLEAAAKSLSVQFGTMPVDQAKAFYEIISSGTEDVTQATELLAAANKLAIGGNTDLATSVDGLTNIMNSYSGKVESAEAVSDALFVGMKAGKANMEEFSSGLGKVTPLASALNVSFDELVATIAALSKQGIQTSESITGVRAILAAVAKPSAEAAKLADQLGLEFNAAGLQAKGFAGFLDEVTKRTGGSADKLAVLFGGVESLVPMMALAGQAGNDFNQIMLDMGNKAGATQTAFEKMAASPGFKIDRLMASINNIAITLGDTLAGILVPAAEAASKAINNLFGIKQLSAIDQQKKKIADLQEQLASLNDRKNIPVVGGLLFDKREADLLSQQIEDYQADLVKMEQAAAESSAAINKESNALNALDLALKPVTDSRNKNTAATKGQISEGERFLQSLTREVDQLGKTTTEIKRLEAAKLGVLDVAAPLIDKIEQETIALKDAEEAANLYKSQLDKTAQITESVMTGEERYAQTQAELNQLVNAGVLSQETYNRALQKAEEQFLKTGTTGKQAFDEISQFSIQAQRNLQNALGDALFDGINGRFDDMVDGFENAILRMITEALAADIWGALFNKPTGNMASLFSSFGLSGSTATSGRSSGMGIMDIASFGSSATNLFSGGSGFISSIGSKLPGSAGSFFSGMGATSSQLAAAQGSQMLWGASGMSSAASTGASLSSAASLGSSLSAVAGPLAIAYAATAILRSFAGDKRMGGGFGDALNFMGDIPILGDFMPVVPLMNVLFGRGPLEQKETNLIGDFTAGGFSGITSTKFKAEGGAFISDKVDRVMTDTDSGELLNQYGELVEGGIADELQPFADQAKSYATELGQYLDDSISGISTSLRSVADSLGLGTEALDNFSMGINIASEKGEALTDEQIGQVIADAGDAMARSLIPGIDSLSKSGESALQTMERLGLEFSSLEGAAAVLSGSMSAAKEAVQGLSFEERTELVDRAGGVDALNQQVSFFATNFLSPDDQYKLAFESLNEQLGELGLSADMSKEQYAELIRSVTEVGGVSVETASKLLELAPTFLQVKDAAEQLNAEAKQIKLNANLNALSLAENLAPDEVLGIKYSMMSDVLSEFGISADISREQLTEYVREFVNSGGLLTAAADSVMTAVGIALDYFNTVDLNKAKADQNLLSLAGTFAPEEVTGIKQSMADDALSQFGLSVDMGKEALIDALTDFVKAGGLFTNMADDVMNAASQTADFFSTLDQANLDAVNTAYADLERSVDAERTRLTDEYNTALDGINTQIESVTDSISKLKSLSDALKTTINDIQPMGRDEAKAQIESAINTARAGGGLPNVEDISQALDVLKEQSTSGFTSSFDFAFEQAKTASMLGELGALTDGQLSVEESTLSALEDSRDALTAGFEAEMLRLDGILEDAQTQIGLLTGIETNTKKIADALENFRIAISNASVDGGNISGSVPDSYYQAIAGEKFGVDPDTVTVVHFDQNGQGVTSGTTENGGTYTIDYGSSISNADIKNFADTYKMDDPLAVYNAAIANGISMERLSEAANISIEDINKFLSENNLEPFAAGGFTGAGGKFDPVGIVHAGEYVFSQEAVKNLGVGALDSLHESAKRGEPEGYAIGGLVSSQNIINRSDVNRINMAKNIIDASSLFEKRKVENDIASELTNAHESIRKIEKEQKSISKIEETANALNSLNDTNSISNLENVINAKHIFENRTVSSEAKRDLLSRANITSEVTRKSIFDRVRELQRVEMNRGFASGGYTGNAGRDDPVGIVHGQEYVFSAPAVESIGLDTLERLHKSGKEGKPSGFADGGFVGGDIGPAPIVESTRPNTTTTNNNQSIQLNQDEVIALLDLLLKETQKQTEYTRRTSNKLDAVTQGGTALRTKTA